MKKITLAALAVFIFTGLNAQIFTDNFESYALGTYIGPQSPQWRTWSASGEGTAEDVKTNNLQASSATQSIYFSSTSANGGPQDVVLDFGQMYTSGVFTYESDFYVNTGKTAYFNFQGNNTIGGLYALDVYMDNGNLSFQSGGQTKLATSYPQGAWFTLTVECNLTTKIWKAKINGLDVGNWINAVNSVRYLDLYPILNSQFYVDDVSFDHTSYTLSNLNAAAATLNMGGGIASQVVNPTLVVVNAGTTAITSFDVTLNYNGNNLVSNVTGVNIASLASTTVSFSNLTLVAGTNTALATISNVNGGTDDVASDNTSQLIITPIVPAVGKMVVGEEGTGTWCQWCPRGAVFMDQYENDFSDFWAGIAVHNGDPMAIAVYDQGMNFSGYPSAKVDRVGAGMDPSAMQGSFFTRLQTPPTAFVEVGATYDTTTRLLHISGKFDFQMAANSGYKAAFVITEDGVTGGSGYAQANAYAGGGNGVMGGYELLPNPVPASLMVYDHVARAIQPSFNGFAGSFPTTVTAGSSHAVNHMISLPAGWNADSIHIVVMLVTPNGQIDNAGKATIAEAVSNGFVSGTGTSGVGLTEMNQVDETFMLYPNPATTQVALAFNLKNESQVAIRVMDMTGKVLASRTYEGMNGANSINYNTSELNAGIYTVEVMVNGERITRRLIIE